MEAEFGEKRMSEVVPRDAYPALSSTPGGTLQNSTEVVSYIHNDDPQEPKDHAIWVLVGSRSSVQGTGLLTTLSCRSIFPFSYHYSLSSLPSIP